MRRFLAIALLSSTLVSAAPRDIRDGGGDWLSRIHAFISHVFHGITTTGDGLVPPKP